MSNVFACDPAAVPSNPIENTCIVMFSGGRDSTLAALRLHRARSRVALVTVSSGHLVGIDRVKRRLAELAQILPAQTACLQVRQPADLRTDVSFYDQTCLPCHHAYVVVSAAIAATFGARRLAFGYAGYQSDWPEQTPLAVSRLEAVLARHGIALELPVYDLASRSAAKAELTEAGLSDEALEQKCLRQVTNVALDEQHLTQQVNRWEDAIDRSLTARHAIHIDVTAREQLGAYR